MVKLIFGWNPRPNLGHNEQIESLQCNYWIEDQNKGQRLVANLIFINVADSSLTEIDRNALTRIEMVHGLWYTFSPFLTSLNISRRFYYMGLGA